MKKLAIHGGSPIRSKPFPKWPVMEDADRDQLVKTIESGIWGYQVQLDRLGPNYLEFSRKFAQYQNAKHAFLVNNGSAALEIALMALGIGPGDEVIIPPLTFMATAAAVVRIGAVPVFADVDPHTYCLDPVAVANAMTPNTKAIIPVHLGCCLADMDELIKVAERYQLALIEDCAHVAGAKWRGRGVGSMSSIGCFSFQLTKPLTCGEGGAVVTSDDELEQLMYSILNCGRTRENEYIEANPLGWNHRLSEFQASVLLTQFARMESLIERKKKNVLKLVQGISDLEWIEPVQLDERVTQRQYYYLTLRFYKEKFEGIHRDVFIKALNAEGIPTYYGYTPLYRDKLFVDINSRKVRGNPFQRQEISYAPIECQVAERAATEEAINIFHPVLIGTHEDMDDILDAFHKIDQSKNELHTDKD